LITLFLKKITFLFKNGNELHFLITKSVIHLKKAAKNGKSICESNEKGDNGSFQKMRVMDRWDFIYYSHVKSNDKSNYFSNIKEQS